MQVIALENVPSAQRGGKELSLLDVTRALAKD
ncbi:Glycosyltransferase family 1 [Halomicronema hongdechloris C2206]|uniref:Glycosyltransferase family 1 n=1 Tax=Halomicronema hongdechloris C2206 TaxID=1641165 RepID=A0A1Z3HJ53_9CYAN|nr:Glycosyltransferase family 1 [Halomicronema hongdechloris C2206]